MVFTIPEDVVEKVREAADIVDVISDHVTLRQTGRSFKALCPFHHEKTPSFVVSREKQIFHCFGCGAGGNAINFVMQFENVTFPEAVRSLAKRYGITVPKTTPQPNSEMEFAYRLNALAAKIYCAALAGTKEGTQAKAYLKQRGVGEDVQKDFMIGYAPSEGSLLLQETRRLKIDPARVASHGLAVGTGRDVRELFRRRLMFPIISAGGRILGFGGRVLDADAVPKYLNSPDTRAFRKGNVLYGIHAAKGELRAAGGAVVVEGYMDVIALHSQGLRNVVASLGTAFTPEQGRALRRYAETVVFMYDGDQAGEMATLRACPVAAEADLKISVVRLPEGHDPDSFVRQAGRDAMAEMIAAAVHYVDFILSQTRGRDMEEVVKFALGVIAKVRDPIRAALDLKRLAERSGVDAGALTKSLGAVKSKAKRGGEMPAAPADNRPAPCDKVEKSLISILIGFPEYAEQIFESLSPPDFLDQRMRKIAEIVCDRRSRNLGFDASALLTVVEEEPVRAMLIECSMSAQTGDTGRMVSDHVLCVRKRGVAREIDQLRKQIRAAETEGDRNLLETLLAKRQELAHELRLLST